MRHRSKEEGAMQELRGAVSVVTGGGSGIGLAIARELAAEGGRIVLADIDEAALAGAAASIESTGAEVLTVRTDVGVLDDVEALARAALDRFGKVDVVVANAGVIAWNPVSALTIRDWRWVIDVNLWGVVHCAHVFLPIMRAQSTPGRFVTSASVGGLLADTPFMAAYAATKGAVIGLALTLASELALAGSPIGVTILCPSNTRDTAVHDAERNRPADAPLLQHAPGVDGLIDQVRAVIEAGQPVEVLARRTVEAMRSKALWVFPHPDAQPMIQPRLDALAAVLADAGRQKVG
jgi:NAD(P)-dependent dehydrogenase (short-subunit alcohol dehydrogenase family)